MIQIEVKIMGKSYHLTCKSDKESQLREAVKYLDQKMCQIRDSGKVKGNDRITVMAAIAISAEMLEAKMPGGLFADMTVAEINKKITEAHEVLDKALLPQGELF